MNTFILWWDYFKHTYKVTYRSLKEKHDKRIQKKSSSISTDSSSSGSGCDD